MNFEHIRDQLVSQGYSPDTANAKIAHDIVLAAVNAANISNILTVKGGVLISGLTNSVRRATMDMDIDFVHYSISNAAVRHFIAELNRAAECRIQIDGTITELKHQDYHGKRLFLKMTDSQKNVVRTKLDIGVHTWSTVDQPEFGFKVVTDNSTVTLHVNPAEQIFVEKLKSLLRIGPASTRFKDVFDLYFLLKRVRKGALSNLIDQHIFQDAILREATIEDIIKRLTKTFSNATFARGLKNPTFAWLDISPDEATQSILALLTSLSKA